MDFKNLFINNNNFVYKFVHPTRTNLEQKQKNKLKFSFSHSFEVQPSEATQRSVKIKIWVNFYFNRTFWNAWGRKD